MAVESWGRTRAARGRTGPAQGARTARRSAPDDTRGRVAIRPGKVDDISAIVELGARLHRERLYRRVACDRDWGAGNMRRYASGHRHALLPVAHRGGRLVGFFAGRMTSTIICPDLAGVRDLL
jgi:hypothetical protein